MKRTVGLAVALAGACLVIAGCNNGDESASLTTEDQAVTAAETKAEGCCPAEKAKECEATCGEKAAECEKKSECTKGAEDEVSAAETKASTCTQKSSCTSAKPSCHQKTADN